MTDGPVPNYRRWIAARGFSDSLLLAGSPCASGGPRQQTPKGGARHMAGCRADGGMSKTIAHRRQLLDSVIQLLRLG